MADAIWHGVLDGRYDCNVTRDSESLGTLTITDTATGEAIHYEGVTLSYGAAFGPDVADVRDWQERCVAVIDALANPETSHD